MVNRQTTPTEWDRRLITGFRLYKSRILMLQAQAFTEEDIYGESNKFHDIWFYHMLTLFGMLLKLRQREGISFQDLSDRYNFENIRKKLACKSIDFNELLQTYEIAANTEQGISSLEIDNTFRVGIEATTPSLGTVDIRDFIEDKAFCRLTPDAEEALAAQTNVGLDISDNTLIEL